ncbi:MAG: DEAD/DEAH box helicase family protein, partial [Eubacterium sp.]|nr:DEAD/DEAH box helicase family protein [Eubacterium sp.]
ISKEIINEFAQHLIKQRVSIVEYEPVTGSWNITDKNYYGSNAICQVEFGINRYNALKILESTLNLREIKLYTDGEYDERDTIAAIEKQRLLIEEFKRWLWDDEDRIWEVEEAYNNMFAGFEKQTYDGSKLEFPEMSKNFSLYDYQKDAVQKIVTTKNTLLAFDVGAGKTYIMIAAAMKMREMGISRKNMFVVPNNIVGQWEKIFSDLYPKAKLLTIDPKSYKPELRTKTLTQIRDGDYDGIIIAYSCFEMIPLSDEFVLHQMTNRLEEINEAVYTVYGFCKNQLSKERDRIKNLTYQFIESMDSETSSITFDQLEINTLFLDEAHNYKNIPLHTKLRNLNGINTKGSKKCLDMQKKIQCVQEQNNGRGAVLATGTPLCNSISDAYAMQMYLQPEEMKERHLDVFDNWVKTFASPAQICEIDVDTSKFRFIRRFAKFFNLPELSRMFSDVAIFHAVEEKGLPDMNGYTDIVIKKNKPLADYMQALCKRTELIRDKVIDKKYDNMLKVSTDGRKAALDLNLVGETQQYNSKSKLYHCVNSVMDIYSKHEGCSQLIFCDYSTPKSESFNVYNKLKEMLLEKGIPDKEIAFIHSYQTEARKLKLFKEVNEGSIRILIGSTIKLGIGANVQTKLKAIHHLDVPWRPADMVQREGRILRRGNENAEIFIYRYIAEGSFDSYSWQILETKQKFISQFLSGSTYQRTATDLEENVLTYAQVKAIALAQPLMKLKAEKENELRNLQIMLSKENEAESNLQKELEELKEKIEKHTKRLSFTTANNLMLSNYDEKNFALELKLYKNVFSKEFIFSSCEDTGIILLGFELKRPIKQDEKKPYLIASRLGVDYMIPVSTSESGNITRMRNFFKGFDKQLQKEQKILDEMIARKD